MRTATKRRDRLLAAMALAICGIVLTGCSARLADFTLIGNRNIDFENNACVVDKTKRISGTDTAFLFLIIPFGLPDYETAVADACKKVPNCVGLSNATIKGNGFWLLFGYNEIEAEGYPVLCKDGN